MSTSRARVRVLQSWAVQLGCAARRSEDAMATRRCSLCHNLNLPGENHNARTHARWITSMEGQEALQQLPAALAAQQQRAAAQARELAEAASSRRTSVAPRSQRRGQQHVPVELRRRHGDRVRRRLDAGWTPTPTAPKWRPLLTSVDAILSRPQLLEVMLGAKARVQSKKVLANVNGMCPHLDVNTMWHTFYTMFDQVVVSTFCAALNCNLRRAGQQIVSPREFCCFIATFLMRAILPHWDAVLHMCAGRADGSVKGLLSQARFQMIKRHFTLLPHASAQSEAVRVVAWFAVQQAHAHHVGCCDAER